MNTVMIDVREKDEFDAEHIQDSIHLPMSEFEKKAPALLKTLSGKTVILMCRSGKRASLAATQAKHFSTDLALEVYQGGILEWKKQNRPTVASKKFHLPLMRQVQLGAGILVFLGTLAAYFLNPVFLLVTGFVGTGLTVAGLTGFCGLGELLVRMPWNRTIPGVRQELCQVGSPLTQAK